MTGLSTLFALLLTTVLLLVAPGARAADGLAPAGGSPVIDDAGILGFALRGPAAGGATLERLGPDAGVRVTTTHRPPNPWDVQLAAGVTAPVRKGDTLLALFRARSVDSPMQEAAFQFNVELNRAPWTKSVESRHSVGESWQTFSIAFTAAQDYAPGEAQATFQLGFGRQTIQIDGLQVLSYGDRLRPEDLPRTLATYRGRGPDAPWRAEAHARIDRLRKADITLRVVDAAGRPVPNARVRIRQTRHAFPFGSAVTARDLAGSTPDAEPYRRKVAELFNEAVFENAMKWEHWGLGDPEQVDAALAWLEEHDIPVRGHCLVWPGDHYLPAEARAAKGDPEKLRRLTKQRILDAGGKHAGRLVDWDVLNEPVTNREIQKILGDEVEAQWFVLARGADPHAVLYVNDFGLMTEGDSANPKLDAYEAIIRRLIDQGAPLGGIGMQGHFGTAATPPEELWKIWDRFAAFGLPIKITEFDMTFADRELQADYMRDFLTAAFAHPAIAGVLQWGFWAPRHWRPEAALFNEDWSARPHGQVYLDLVYDEWMTSEEATTDADGEITLRGFKGDYEITADGAEPLRLRLENDEDVVLEVRPAR